MVTEINNIFGNYQHITAEQKDDASQMLSDTIIVVSDFWSFVKKIIYTADFDDPNVPYDYSEKTFNNTLQRVDVIKIGLQNLQLNLANIEENVKEWYSNDDDFSISDLLDPSKILTYVPTWPLILNLLSASFCLGASALYHLGYIKSESVSRILSRLDYGGIGVLIAGSSYPVIYYSFACEPVQSTRNILMALISSTSFLCFAFTMLPSMDKPKFRSVRGIMFMLLGISAAIPFVSYAIKQPTR